MAIQSSTESPLLAAMMPAQAAPAPASPVEPPVDDEEPESQNTGYGRPTDIPVKQFLVDQIGKSNLADNFSPTVLDRLGGQVVEEFNIDENSRSEWKDKAEKAMKYALQVLEAKIYPWPNSSNIKWPLIAIAAMQFNARTYPAIIKNRNVVKGTVWGTDRGTPATEDGKPDGKPKMHPDGSPIWLSAPGEKRKRADRIGNHMSYQLLEEMEEWEPQTDTMLMQIPIMGGACRKTFRDDLEHRNMSVLVSLDKLVWNYHSASFTAAPRHTEILELYPHEIEEYERAKIFLPLEYGPAGSDENREGASGTDDDAPHVFLEQHRRSDLDEDGYPEPYVVTVHKRSGKVVRVVARYDEDGIKTDVGPKVDMDDETGGLPKPKKTKDGNDEDENEIIRIKPVEHYTLIPFLPNPDGGSYPVGFGHLLQGVNAAIDTTINQMFDAGHLQNAGGGFISNELSIASGDVSFTVGKYKRVGSKGMNIRDAVFPMPFQGPSAVLFQLLGLLMNAGKEMASTQDILAGDAAKADASPTTILALIEQGLTVYTAIHKRVYRALKSEFAKIYRLNRIYLKEAQRYQVGDDWCEVTPEDYRLGGGVEPIADPTMLTDMQKLGRAQILMGFKDDPTIDQKEIKTRLFDAANIDRIEDLFVPPNPMQQLLAQVAVQEKQAGLGRIRAAELKDNTQAFLNMAMARAKASGPEMDWIEKQLDLLRLHIEATNTQVRAAEVQRKHHADMRDATDTARENAHAQPEPAPPIPLSAGTPAPGPDTGGIQPVAPQPDNGGVPPVPGGLPGVVPDGGGGLG